MKIKELLYLQKRLPFSVSMLSPLLPHKRHRHLTVLRNLLSYHDMGRSSKPSYESLDCELAIRLKGIPEIMEAHHKRRVARLPLTL